MAKNEKLEEFEQSQQEDPQEVVVEEPEPTEVVTDEPAPIPVEPKKVETKLGDGINPNKGYQFVAGEPVS